MTPACFHISGVRCSNCATPATSTYVPVSMPSDLAEIERLKKLLAEKDERIHFLEDMIDDLIMAPDKILNRSVSPAQIDCDHWVGANRSGHYRYASSTLKDLWDFSFCPKCRAQL